MFRLLGQAFRNHCLTVVLVSPSCPPLMWFSLLCYYFWTFLTWSGNQKFAWISCIWDRCKRWFSIKSRGNFSDRRSEFSRTTSHSRTTSPSHPMCWFIWIYILNLTAFLSLPSRLIWLWRYSLDPRKMPFYALYLNIRYSRLPLYLMVEPWYVLKLHLQFLWVSFLIRVT